MSNVLADNYCSNWLIAVNQINCFGLKRLIYFFKFVSFFLAHLNVVLFFCLQHEFCCWASPGDWAESPLGKQRRARRVRLRTVWGLDAGGEMWAGAVDTVSWFCLFGVNDNNLKKEWTLVHLCLFSATEIMAPSLKDWSAATLLGGTLESSLPWLPSAHHPTRDRNLFTKISQSPQRNKLEMQRK